MAVPLPVINGVYYAYLHGTTGGLTTGNIYAWKCSLPPTTITEDQGNAQIIADALPAEWATTVAPLYPNDTTGWDSRVYALGHPTLPAALGHTSHSGSGGVAMAAFPTAAIIRHNVVRRGRGSQSHTSISPVVQTNIANDGQHLIDSFRLGLTTEFENFIGQVQANFAAASGGPTIDYVQLSKKGAGATYVISSSFAEPLVGSERSRTLRP